jgi:hypothetical protein
MAPYDPLKFVVVDPTTKNRSSVWRVWTAKKKDDVYLAELTTAPTWKVSHHLGGGVLRIAMTNEAARLLGTERTAISSWPWAPPPDGWSEGVTVLVPSADLRPQVEQIDTTVIQVPVSPGHSAVGVRLFFQEPSATQLRGFSAAFGVGALSRPTGGCAYLFAEPVALDARQHDALAAFRADARERSATQGEMPDRFVGVLQVEEHRVLVDLALD